MPNGKPTRGQRDHWYVAGGHRLPRAAFAGEPEAHAAANRVFNAVGRRYSAYPCRLTGCGAWHIRPCPLRPEDLARPA
jgi:hypothetical protein